MTELTYESVPWMAAAHHTEVLSAIIGIRIPNLVVVDEEARVQVRVGRRLIWIDDYLWRFLEPDGQRCLRPLVLAPGMLFKILLLCSDYSTEDITELCEWKRIVVSDDSVVAEILRMEKKMTARPTVDELLRQGAQQLSRKYRHVARLPPNTTGLEAMRERAPGRYAEVMRRAEQWAADEYRRYVAQYHGDHFELTVDEFSEFLVKTGRGNGWKPKGEACEHCKSLGHVHSRDCPNWGNRGR
jgi:hypothetical protein